MRQRKGFHSVANILQALGKSYPGFSRRMKELGALSHWERAVGPAIAKHSRALKIENGVLWVEVDHPTWKSELHFRKRQILEKLQSLEGLDEGAKPSISDLLLIEPRKEPKREASARRPGSARPGSPKPR